MNVNRGPTNVGEPLGALIGIFDNLRLAWRLFWDRRVPIWAKGIPLVSLVYVLWPLDFAPDLIPGLGQLDDLTIVLLGIVLFIKLCPARLVEQHRQVITTGRVTDATAETQTVDATYRVFDEDDPGRP
jgi:uncharacterized membrane protein YkvA (DUF1232 family)